MTSHETFAVRRAAIGDEPILRELRLQALSDSPDAFGSTYERELARTPLDWQRWLSPGATFVLDQPGGPAGIVAGQHDALEAAVVHLMAMWVHPRARGTGGADALVAAVIAWAAAERASVIRLAVIKSNAPARHCYERNGFTLTGHEATRDTDGRIEVRMERLIPMTG
jgi:GNAT superfamily N-acetyltransferase